MLLLGSVGYGIAALGYAALFFLLLVAWQGRGTGWRLVVAALVTVLWAAALVMFPERSSAFVAHTVALDALRYVSWLAVLAAGTGTLGSTSNTKRAAWLACLVVLCIGSLAFVIENTIVSQFALVGAVLMSMLGMWLLIRAYVDSALRQRKALVYLGLGLGSVMVCDAVLYLQTLLPDTSGLAIWSVRGYVASLAVPLIALAVTRGSHWPVRFAISRDIAFYTTLAAAVGGYVILAAVGGYLLRLKGGDWGETAQLILYSAAVAGLIPLVASTSLRRRLRVLLVKHFFEHKYDYREEWLRFIETLSENAAGGDSRVTGLRAIAQILTSPAAVLFLKEEGRQQFGVVVAWPSDASIPLAADELCANGRLIELLERHEWVVDVADQRHGRLSRESLDLPDWLITQSRWRLIVPVLFRKRLMGMILLEDPPGEFSLTFEDRDLLKTVARHVATHLAQHEAEQRLAESTQFEAYSRLAAFLLHDLKNAAAQLRMVVANAGRHKHNPDFIDDAIETVANAADRISGLIDQLGRGTGNEVERPVRIEDVVAAVIERNIDRKPCPSLIVEKRGLYADVGSEQLGSVVEHLIRNAQDATPSDGRIEVLVQQVKETAVIEISDTGHGMTNAFVRDRLFKPFESTKGGRGMGIGAYQAREFARSHGGDICVESSPGRGTTVRVMLPILKVAEVA